MLMFLCILILTTAGSSEAMYHLQRRGGQDRDVATLLATQINLQDKDAFLPSSPTSTPPPNRGPLRRTRTCRLCVLSVNTTEYFNANSKMGDQIAAVHAAQGDLRKTQRTQRRANQLQAALDEVTVPAPQRKVQQLFERRSHVKGDTITMLTFSTCLRGATEGLWTALPTAAVADIAQRVTCIG